MEALKEEGVFSRNFLNNVASAVGNVATVNSIVSLLDQYNTLTHNTSSGPSAPAVAGSGPSGHNLLSSPTKFGLSQLLSTAVSSISESNAGSGGNANTDKTHSNAYSPLLSIIDYIQSLQSPRHATASKRKTPNEFEDYLPPETSDKPQTPCLSSEEYISPTYARNYQGVWKYVVQIPHEGLVIMFFKENDNANKMFCYIHRYFTQTVQQTTCL